MEDGSGLGRPTDRASRVRALVAREPVHGEVLVGTALTLHRLCRTAARITSAHAVAVSLMTDHGPSGIVATLDGPSGVIEELQFILGEGPAWDAYEMRTAVLAARLDDDGALRWPGYCAAVGAHGVQAAFVFPLIIGSARIGVLGIYRAEAGPLSDGALADAFTLADLATEALLDGQQEAGDEDTPPGIDDVLESRFAVYQAQGMVMVQLGVSLRDAMARLRAHAYAEDRTLGSVARDIVARTLSFDGDDR